MRIETHHIPSQGTTFNYHKQADQFATLEKMIEAGECRFKSVISIDLDVVPAPDFIGVAGRLTAVVQLNCSRCLTEYEWPINHAFKITYSQKIPKELQENDTQGVELTAEQIGVVFYSGDVIDFTETVQEQAVLALPYKPLCKKACKGLCPHCGVDLNYHKCQCGLQTTLGPFDVLKKLKLPDS